MCRKTSEAVDAQLMALATGVVERTDSYHHEADAIQVLNLTPCAGSLPWAVHRHIDVAA